MKVNHKTFSGGFRFKTFEGSPSEKLLHFEATSKNTNANVDLKGSYLEEILYNCGITNVGGIPTNKSDLKIKSKEATDVIINAVEADIFNLSVSVLIKGQQMDYFLKGLEALSKYMPKANFIVAIGEDKDEIITRLMDSIKTLEWIKVVTVAPKYPINLEELLVPTIINKAYPIGYSSLDIGAVVIDVQDVMHIYDAAINLKSLEYRTVVLAGSAWKENCHLKVAIGTKLTDIIKKYAKQDVKYRFVINSLMTNEVVNPDELVIEKTTSCLIAIPEGNTRKWLSFMRPGMKNDSYTNAYASAIAPKGIRYCETNIHGEHRPCISCGYCMNVCPKGLIPHLLHRHVDKNILNERVAELGIFDCIGCNLCNYVCTSKINVSSSIKEGKEKLEQQEISHEKYMLSKCDLIHEVEVKSDER